MVPRLQALRQVEEPGLSAMAAWILVIHVLGHLKA